MKKIIRYLHLWLSIPFGLIIAVVCFSGAALVFEPEIMKLCYPSRYYVEAVREAPLPLAQLIAAANRRLPDSAPIANVQIPASPRESYRLGFPGRGTPPLFVDPYTGAVCDRPSAQGSFFSTMRRLHRWLLDDFKYGEGASTGKIVVGVSTLVFVFIIIAGIIMWIPKSRKGLRANLSIKLGASRKRLWRDLHVALGIYTALILLALALTGLTWSFSWYRNGFYRVFGAEPPQMVARQGGNSGTPSRGEGNRGENRRDGGVNYSQWQVVAEKLRAQYPRFKSLTIQNGRASVSLSSTGNVRATDSYTFDPATGDITGATLYKDADRAGKLRGWIYSVHVGSWGGMATRILTFLAALFGATLPLTGYYLWISRRIRRWRKCCAKPGKPKMSIIRIEFID
ncbi:MAG: PepSY domain-containing protein [Prevotellaceae bacterium]|jgi:uncharacterized iron-regulated membrane protein|nr:PepSY domain-containing protein [Prevotellaceae bacterium]